MLNRVLNLARRQKPQAFPPRKRAMAATCFGQPQPEDELATFVEDAGPPGTPLFASPEQPAAAPPEAGRPARTVRAEPAPRAASSGAPSSGNPPATAEEAGLALGQMRLAIENGLLMVFGPEGDPVPPRAFAAAAAARPDTPLGLPDGTRAPASRVAAVLRAQTLGRLGAAQQAADWILAMLRDGSRPEQVSEAALRAEQEMLGAADGLTVTAEASIIATGAPPGGRDKAPADGHKQAAAAASDRPAVPRDEAAICEGLDQASLDRAAASIEASFAPLPRLELDLEALVPSTDAGLDLDFSADRVAENRFGEPDEMPVLRGAADVRQDTMPPARRGAADAATDDGSLPQRAADPALSVPGEEAADIDPIGLDADSMVLVLMRGVPEDARLSAGARDDDGTWSISPLDLPTVTISPAAGGSGAGAGEEASGDLSITGIGFADDGELVAISEAVPLADYLDDPAAGDPASIRQAAKPASQVATGSRQRTIPLELDPEALAGESFDALLIRDLPAGARLSAGAYDPTIDGWVLRPQDLRALAILPPPELRAEFTVTLLGIALRPGEANAARVLARLPVRLA